MTTTIDAVRQDAIRDLWPYVRTGLDELQKQFAADWIPEEVFAELMAGRYSLFMVNRGSEAQGFFVARATAGIDGVVLFIWVCWMSPNSVVFEEGLPELDRLAKSVGAKRIRHESPRQGWAKKGFNMKMYIYEREV